MNDKVWFILKDKHHFGPFNPLDLKSFLVRDEISADTMLWREGQYKWLALEEIDSLKFLLGPDAALPALPLKEASALPPLPLADFEVTDPIVERSVLEEVSNEIIEDSIKEKVSVLMDRQSMMIMGLAVLGVLISLYFLGSSTERPQNLSGLALNAREAIENIRKRPFDSDQYKRQVRFVAGDDGAVIVMGTNDLRETKVFLTLKSVPGKFFGKIPVVITAEGILRNGLARFEELKIEKGDRIIPGEYEVLLKGYVLGVKDRLLSYFYGVHYNKDIESLEKYESKGKILFFSSTSADFLKKLDKYNKEFKRKKIDPLVDRVERFKSFMALLETLYGLYDESINEIKKGISMKFFEDKYNQRIGPYLRDLIIDNNRLHISYVNIDPVASRNYEEIMEFGKSIGDLASRMVTETRKNEVINDEIRGRFKHRFLGEARRLKEKGTSHLKRLRSEIKTLE